MLRRAGRIAHVVQAIEERNQIVSLIRRIALRAGHFERDLILQAVAPATWRAYSMEPL